jgi:hypothetical protein
LAATLNMSRRYVNNYSKLFLENFKSFDLFPTNK